jgi:hypothetical protein
MMTDSAFWRELHDKFVAFQDRLRASSGATCLTYKQFEVLAKRGASGIARPGTSNLLSVWLEAVWKEDPDFRSLYLAKEVSSLPEFEQNFEIGTLDHMCQDSATFCKKLEEQAVQAEFEEKQRNDPRNWSQFRLQYEAVKSVREIRSEPPEQISEEFVRQAIARIRGIKPEDVTRKQIAFEVAGLLSSTRRHIELIPSDSTKAAATDLPDLLNEPPGMEFLGDRSDRMVKTKKIPTTAEAVSKQLLTEVNSLFKKFRMRRFKNVEDLAEADEWQGLNHLFRGAGERYAKSSFREERARLEWSRKNIESDRQAIHQQHAQHFCLLQSRRSDLGVANVFRVFETKLDFAMSEAMCAAAVCIDGSELLNRDRLNSGATHRTTNTHRRRHMNLEKVTFRKLKRGETVAEKPFTDSALLNTYESFSRTLAEMRAFIKARARDGMALHEKLKDNFGRTELGRAATEESWMTWVDDFLKQNATARNVALVFLEHKTGLKRGTLKVRFSAARKKQKMRH